jgi:hypothetical protein
MGALQERISHTKCDRTVLSYVMCFLKRFEQVCAIIKFSDFASLLLFLVCGAFFESYIFRLVGKLHLNLLRCIASRMTEDVINVL